MKQLKIFNSSISQSIQIDLKKRIKKDQKTRQKNIYQCDLWQQEREEEKEMALFFLDIRNFTPFVENHSAFDVIQVIRKLFSVFQNIIRVNYGQIIETSGDGFYAAFGFDRSLKEAANAAVKAGKSIINHLEILNQTSLQKKLNRSIEVGIGVHVGKVAAGNILLNGHNHLIVMGYPVNIASRLEAATKEFNNNFIVSSTVFDLLNTPIASRTATTNLKGVAEPCQLHLIGREYSHS